MVHFEERHKEDKIMNPAQGKTHSIKTVLGQIKNNQMISKASNLRDDFSDQIIICCCPKLLKDKLKLNQHLVQYCKCSTIPLTQFQPPRNSDDAGDAVPIALI